MNNQAYTEIYGVLKDDMVVQKEQSGSLFGLIQVEVTNNDAAYIGLLHGLESRSNINLLSTGATNAT